MRAKRGVTSVQLRVGGVDRMVSVQLQVDGLRGRTRSRINKRPVTGFSVTSFSGCGNSRVVASWRPVTSGQWRSPDFPSP